MNRALTFLVGLCLLYLLTAFAQPLTPAAALERFFTEDEVQPDWFAQDFLAQVPLAQITELRQQVTDQLGAFQGIEGEESPFTVSFAEGKVTAEIALDEAGQIAGLRITPAESAPEPSPADPDLTPQAALERLFTSDTIAESWFSDAFLATAPLPQIEGLVAQAKEAGGALQQVAGAGSPFTLRFAVAQTTAEITLDNSGRIIGLLIQPLIPRVDTLDAAMEQFAALPGEVSVLVREDGEELAALNADEALGIGSAFKLAILTALRAQIDAGEHSWDEVVTLDPALKSLPGGMLQDWPDGSPLTIHTLATLMISISDNTATDILLHLVGREVVEEYAGDNRPLLNTKELFKLKAASNADLLEQYLAGDEAEKRALLDQLAARPLPTPADMPGGPTLDVEWFFTPSDLCELMAQVQDLDLMTVSPGVANPAEWARVAFKGGSEIGVLNLTQWLATEEGTAYCVVVTQNRDDAAVDETLLASLTRATIGLLGPSLPITNSTGLTETGTVTATAPTTATGTTTNTGALTATTALTAATTPTVTGAVTATTTPPPTETTTGTGALTMTAPLVFANVRLFDGERVITATNVVVEDGLITAVGPDVEQPAGAQVIDGAGKTLLPGLIDAHTHVFSPDALRQALVFGVTTELDMGMDYKLAAQLRREQTATGAVERADLFSAGTVATAPGGHGTQFGLEIPTLTSPQEAEAFVAERVAEGSDYLKIILEDGSAWGTPLPSLDQATVAALVQAAHERNLLTLTHIQTLATAQQALAVGTDGLAHIFADTPPDEEYVENAVANHLFVVATMAVFQGMGGEPVDTSIIDDPHLAPYLTPADVQSLSSPTVGVVELSLTNAQEAVRQLFAAGVPILAGTDAPQPGTAHGASLHQELVLLTEAGLSPLEALRSATSVTADIFGLTDRGRIAPGLRADLLLVNGDPTATITATRDIAGVWKLGVAADRASYLANLEAQRAAAEAARAAFAAQPIASVSDFEANNLATEFGAGWSAFTDQLVGGASMAELAVVDEGADGSNRSLRVAGEVTDTLPYAWAGAMFSPGATPFAPFDLSSKPTLHFWAKGDGGLYRVQLSCTGVGQILPEQPLPLTAEWQEFSFDLTTFAGCDLTKAMAVIFATGPAPGPFSFHLDEVTLQ